MKRQWQQANGAVLKALLAVSGILGQGPQLIDLGNAYRLDDQLAQGYGECMAIHARNAIFGFPNYEKWKSLRLTQVPSTAYDDYPQDGSSEEDSSGRGEALELARPGHPILPLHCEAANPRQLAA